MSGSMPNFSPSRLAPSRIATPATLPPPCRAVTLSQNRGLPSAGVRPAYRAAAALPIRPRRRRMWEECWSPRFWWRLSGWGRCNTRAVASIRSPIRSPPHRLVSTFAVLTGLLRSITKRLFVLGVVLLFAHASLFLLSLVSTRADEFRANWKVCAHKILAKNTTAITPKIKNATTAALERARSWSSTATT